MMYVRIAINYAGAAFPRSEPAIASSFWDGGHGRRRQLLPVETQVNSTGKRQVGQVGVGRKDRSGLVVPDSVAAVLVVR